MRYGVLAVLLAVAAYVLLCGCGTALNLSNKEQKVFGGTRVDLEVAATPLTRGVSRVADTDPGPHDLPTELQIILAVGALIDLPLTLVGDTLTLPWTVSAELKRFVESRQPEK